MRLFDFDNPIMQFLSRIFDLMYLNILFVICSIPFFTIGASLTAMYSVTLKMVKNEDTYIGKEFFKAFRRNFKQATGIWFIALLVMALLYGDYQILAKVDIPGRSAAKFSLICVSIVCFCMLLYVFPLLARFVNTVKGTIRNALWICIGRLKYTLLLLLIFVFIIMIAMQSSYAMYTTIFVSFIGGCAVLAYVQSMVFRKVFKQFEPEEVTEAAVDSLDSEDTSVENIIQEVIAEDTDNCRN